MGSLRPKQPIHLPASADPDADEAIRRDWAEANLSGGGSGITQAAADIRYVNETDHTKAAHDALDIDADTLDGIDSTGFAPASHVGAGGTAHADVIAAGAAGFMTGSDKTKLDGLGQHLTGVSDTTAITFFPKGASTFEAKSTNGTWPGSATSGIVITSRSLDVNERSYQRFLAYLGYAEYVRWWNTSGTPGWSAWVHYSDIPSGGTSGQFLQNFGSGVYDWASITSSTIVGKFTGAPDGTKFLRDDGVLAVPAGGGGGYTPPWTNQSGAGSIFSAWGDGNPNYAADLLASSGVNVTPAQIGTGVARTVNFTLPVTLAVSAVRIWGVSAATAVSKAAIYRVSDNVLMWESGTFDTLANAFMSLTAATPFTLTVNTDYIMALTAVATGTVARLRAGPAPLGSAFYGANAAPLGGHSIRMPLQAQIALSTASTFPGTMPALAAAAYTTGGAPLAFLEGTAS